MQPKAEHTFSKEKKPVFVSVYDKLYDMLTDGTFPVGSALPSEPKLASMLGVSRMTLRQSLELLHEDGLIEKIKGKGNFVIDRNRPQACSLERLGNPVYKCINLPIDPEVEIEFRLEPPSEYEQNIFKRRTAVAVAVDRFYRSEGKLVAYTLSLVPIEVISQLGVDLNDKKALLHMLENGVYHVADRAQIRVQSTWVGSFISDRYVLTEKGELNLVYESLYTNDDYAPLMHNKHYMLPQHCSIVIQATAEKSYGK